MGSIIERMVGLWEMGKWRYEVILGEWAGVGGKNEGSWLGIYLHIAANELDLVNEGEKIIRDSMCGIKRETGKKKTDLYCLAMGGLIEFTSFIGLSQLLVGICRDKTWLIIIGFMSLSISIF